ncbi:MAG: hypothetical protein AAB461_01005 [Patescibacteria group bacterium]
MNKSRYTLRSTVAIIAAFSFVFLLAGGAYAASTIGTNMSTTGTFLQTVGSATAARFQNAAGTTTVLAVDTTNTRVGVGAAPSTTFEVQGTASASYFFTLNTLQVAGVAATVTYSRFGTGTTGYTADLDASNDLLVTGALEVDGNAFFDGKVGIGGATNTKFEVQGTASASYFLTGNTIQVGGFASVAYNRFGTTATTNGLAATNDVLINGILEVDGKTFLDATASVTTGFEVVGYASAKDSFVTRSLVIGNNVASSNTAYSAEFGGGGGTATVSLLFGSSSVSSKGTCLQMKNMDGEWVYLRIKGELGTVSSMSLVINRNRCL